MRTERLIARANAAARYLHLLLEETAELALEAAMSEAGNCPRVSAQIQHPCPKCGAADPESACLLNTDRYAAWCADYSAGLQTPTEAARKLAEAVLIYHGDKFAVDHDTFERWVACTGTGRCDARVLCDLARRVLAAETEPAT